MFSKFPPQRSQRTRVMGFDTAFGALHRRCSLPDIKAFPGPEQKHLLLPQRQLTERRLQRFDAAPRFQYLVRRPATGGRSGRQDA